MNEPGRNELIRYRMEQADDALATVHRQVKLEEWFVVVNRAYYGMFYALTALALTQEFKTSHHAQLIGWFNKNYVATGRVELATGEVLKEAFRLRMKGDYDAFISLDPEVVKALIPQMELFIGAIKALVFPPVV